MKTNEVNTEKKYKFGKREPNWRDGEAKSVSFIITEDCQLACKYCFLTGKNTKNKMSFDIAKQTVDYLLNERELFPDKAIIWDFTGGEAFLEIEFIDKLSDYIKQQMFELEHPWFDNYRFSLSSNGILYNNSRVQNYIKKNTSHINVGISIDGTKIKQDMQRIYKNGKGSYDDIVKIIPLWLKQFPNASTKATIGHEDLPLIKESVLHLWKLGIKTIHMNVVFEDAWEKGDDEIFENQLVELGDYIIEHKLYNDYNVSLFSKTVGVLLNSDIENTNWVWIRTNVDNKYQW